MHRITITKDINRVKITLERVGEEPFEEIEREVSIIENLLDSHIFNQSQGDEVINRMTKAEIKSEYGKALYAEIIQMNWPVKIPPCYTHLYRNNDLPF